MPTNATKYTSKLVNKNVLVFGGTSGIGFAVAEAALEHGANITITGSNPKKLEAALKRFRTAYPESGPEQIRGYTADLLDTTKLEANLHDILSKAANGGKINHISYSAGDFTPGSALKDITIEIAEAKHIIRLYGPLLIGKILPQYMDLDSSNSFTFTSGTLTDKPMPGRYLEATTGGAIHGLLKGLTVELQPLRINVVSPGMVMTEIMEKNLSGRHGPALREALLTQSTLKKMALPEDVAEAYIYAMKDSFVAGVVITTDGGRLLA